MPDVRLQPVQRQHHPAPGREPIPQPPLVGQLQRQQLLVALDQVPDRALRQHHPALAQRLVDLRHAPMLPVAQLPDQRDHVQPELAVRQRQGAFLFRPIGSAVARAGLASDSAAPPG